MATAYASLISLFNALGLINDNPRHSFYFEAEQIDALMNTTRSLLMFMNSCNESDGASKEAAEALESRIARAAQAAEDVVESHVVDQIRCGSTFGADKSLQPLLREAQRMEFAATDLLHLGKCGFTPDAILRLNDIVVSLKKADVILGADKIFEFELLLSEAIEDRNDACIRRLLKEMIIVYRSLGRILGGKTRPRFLLDLQKSIEDMNFVCRKAVNVERLMTRFRAEQPTSDSWTPLPLEEEKRMVGFDEQLGRLLDLLTGEFSNSLLVIPIVGMGGSGKTTLATNALQHPYIAHHFDVRLSAKISQEFSATKLFSHLLSQINQKISFFSEISTYGCSADELGRKLHKCLYGRRYLIILDDMWSVKGWDELMVYFPNTSNGSCIVVTTRHYDVARCLQNWKFDMRPLNDDSSWDLFCQIIFEGQGCPPQFEDIGKKIVANCKGLPLAIVVVGGHLRKCSRTMEHWENVTNDMNYVWNFEENEWCLNIFYSSYRYLPIMVKPCFLLLGVLSKGRDLSVSDISSLWIGEGFLIPILGWSLERVANWIINHLAESNLISIYERSGSRGRVAYCLVHDLLRELCLKIAKKEGFYCVLDTQRTTNKERRVVIEGKIPEVNRQPQIFNAQRSAPVVRSLICEGGQLSFDLKLLRVLNKVDTTLRTLINSQLVNLRYLKVDVLNKSYRPLSISPSISLLWNLQTLIITRSCGLIIAPYEIWEMLQLRRVEVDQLCLVDPLSIGNFGQESDLVLKNMLTLSKVENFMISEEVCRRIPNIESLKLSYGDKPSSDYYLNNLGCFEKLKSLKCYFYKNAKWRDFSFQIAFPNSLLELCLSGCRLGWEELTKKVGSLPRLEFLALDRDSVIGSEWTPAKGGFSSLKSLFIYECDLIYWNADHIHFPVLKQVYLYRMSKLNEFPSGIGNIPLLGTIRLSSCSLSSSFSAMRMVVEQEEEGNEGLHLDVYLKGDAETIERFKQMIAKEGVKSNNIHLQLKKLKPKGS